jgi:hypothetical protein
MRLSAANAAALPLRIWHNAMRLSLTPPAAMEQARDASFVRWKPYLLHQTKIPLRSLIKPQWLKQERQVTRGSQKAGPA